MSADLDSRRSLPEAFLTLASKDPEAVVYRQAFEDESSSAKPRPRHWRSFTFRQVKEHVAKVAHFLKRQGLNRGDRVAIVSNTRPEWMEADLGILSAGGVVVSVYPSLTAQEIGYLLFDSETRFVFVENEEQLAKIRTILGTEIEVPAVEERPAQRVRVSVEKVIAFEAVASDPLVVQFSQICGEEAEDTFDLVPSLTRDDLAALVYTSGTTGAPKGVMQSHGNHLSNVRQAYHSGIYTDDSSIMLFLPLAHSFAKLMGYIGFLSTATLGFPAVVDHKTSKFNPESISRDIASSGATIVPVVPRLLEKMKAGVVEKSHGASLVGRLLGISLATAARVGEARRAGRSAGLLDELVFAITAPLRKKVRTALFGSSFRCAISGGAKLAPAVGAFFDDLQIPVLEGYGLTETVVATNVNRIGSQRIGSVGPVMDRDIEVRIAADGEILYRGPNVAKGYYRRPAATREAWDADGWFHTGDLGRVDENGFLWIEGRKKELIVTANGKKIPPETIEEKFKTIPYIAQIVLIGEGRSYCCALVTLNREVVDQWARANQHTVATPISADEKVRALIWKEIERVNGGLAGYESVKKIAILDEDFTIENGFLTPTFKVKRKEVTRRLAAQIEALYA